MSPEEKNRKEMRLEAERSGKTQYEMTCEQAAEFVSALYDSERIPPAAAAHIGVCTTCRACLGEYAEMGAELRRLASLETVDEPRVPRWQKAKEVTTARGEPPRLNVDVGSRLRGLWRRQPLLAYAGLMATVLVAFIGAVRFIGGNTNNAFRVVGSPMTENFPAPPPSPAERDRLETFARLQSAPADKSLGASRATVQLLPEQHTAQPSGENDAPIQSGPMIIRTADLQLITKEFDKARAEMEAVLKKHRGYVSELKVSGAAGSGRTLTSTLRVPADQLDSTLAELKTLGRVASESQSGQDVTSQYVDLQARLANARNTEKRLTDILNQRTGKLKDILEVEQEVDRVRGEIEQMEAESKQMTKQVSFATLNVAITEDYKAQLEVVPPSTATRLSNAAVEGYRSMVDGVINLTLFALSNGPTFLLWAAVLFLPARFAWKALRRKMA